MRNLITAPREDHLNKGTIGYGYPVADVTNWTCLENKSDPWVRYEADTSFALPDALVTPGPFVKDYTPVERLGRLQKDFVTGRVNFPLLITEGPNSVLSWGSGKWKMKLGESVRVRHIELGFDGSLFVKNLQTNQRIWESRPAGCANPSEIVFHDDGKLYVQDKSSGQWVDLIPSMPRFVQQQRRPDCDPRHPVESRLVLSSKNPPLMVAPCPNPSKMLFFASAYELDFGIDLGTGNMIIRPQGDHVVMFVLSPWGQWMVLRSKLPNLQLNADPNAAYGGLVNWNPHDGRRMDDARWEVKWQIPDKPMRSPIWEGENAPKVCFQGDGNIVSLSPLRAFRHVSCRLQVMYANGEVRWASGTNGMNPKPCHVRLGDGITGKGWVEIIDERGHCLWHC
jgi:hypothetical protein